MAHAGLRELPVRLLIESILPEIELGLILPFLPRSSSTAKLEGVATEATLRKCISLPKIMEFLSRVVRIILLKTLRSSAARISKNAETAQNSEAGVGLLLAILSGK